MCDLEPAEQDAAVRGQRRLDPFLLLAGPRGQIDGRRWARRAGHGRRRRRARRARASRSTGRSAAGEPAAAFRCGETGFQSHRSASVRRASRRPLNGAQELCGGLLGAAPGPRAAARAPPVPSPAASRTRARRGAPASTSSAASSMARMPACASGSRRRRSYFSSRSELRARPDRQHHRVTLRHVVAHASKAQPRHVQPRDRLPREVLEHEKRLEERRGRRDLAPALDLHQRHELVLPLPRLLRLQRGQPGPEVSSSSTCTRTGRVLMKRPTARSLPASAGGRPDTTPPNTTSCCSLRRLTTSAQTACRSGVEGDVARPRPRLERGGLARAHLTRSAAAAAGRVVCGRRRGQRKRRGPRHPAAAFRARTARPGGCPDAGARRCSCGTGRRSSSCGGLP